MTPTRTPAQLSLSLRVQVAAQYLRYLDLDGEQERVYAQAFRTADLAAWATTRLDSAVASANACQVRGAVVRGVSVEAMARLWELGLDVGIEMEGEIK